MKWSIGREVGIFIYIVLVCIALVVFIGCGSDASSPQAKGAPPVIVPLADMYIADCPKQVDPLNALVGNDPFNFEYSDFILTPAINGVLNSIGVEMAQGGTMAYAELRDTITNSVIESSPVISTPSGWNEFIFNHTLVGAVKVHFVTSNNGRAWNCSGTRFSLPVGLTFTGIGNSGHMARTFVTVR